MANRIDINQQGIREVLKSDGVNAMLKEQADKICSRAESLAEFHSDMAAPAYGAWVAETKYCSVSRVATRRIGEDGMAAINECAKHNTLKKAMGA